MSDIDKFRSAMEDVSAADWKEARKSEPGTRGEDVPFEPGEYQGVLTCHPSVGRGKAEGRPVYCFHYTPSRGPFKGVVGRNEILISADAPDKGLSILTKTLKALFPDKSSAISKMTKTALVDFFLELCGKSFAVEFKVNEYNDRKYINPTAAKPLDDDEDEDLEDDDVDSDDDDEDYEDEDGDDEEEDDEEYEDEEDDEYEDDDDDEEDDEPEPPTKGSVVTVGRTKYKITGVQASAKTVTLTNIKTGTVKKKYPWDQL